MEMGLSRSHFPITTLGPGKRLGIWFQGCHIRCNGCVSMDTWPKAKLLTNIDDFLNDIHSWISLAEGITISGGEPFEQPDALIYLVDRLKQLSPVNILVYSGFAFATIKPFIDKASPHIDVVITGAFDCSAPQTVILKGSDNQSMHILTELGNTYFGHLQHKKITENDRSLDVMFSENGAVWFAGIPRQNDFLNLQTLLEKDGHQLTTSASKPKPHHLNNKKILGNNE